MSQSNNLNLDFELHQRQADALVSPATELLYGGAASGGKSHLSRVMAILWAIEVPGIQIYFFRRLYDDLIKNHIHGPTGFVSMLAAWCNIRHKKSPLTAGRLCEIVEGEIRFFNGSKIFLCHLQHQKDITKYYGVEIHVLFMEEATQFSEFMIRFLRSRLRIPKALKIPDKYMKPKEQWLDPAEPSYYFPRAVYTSNPGGIGHSYIKRAFVEGFKPYEVHPAPDSDGGHARQFIPARVDDNPSVNREEVKANLAGLPPILVDALLNGNWNAVIGAFFPELNPGTHLIKPINIPRWWTRVCAMDWGTCGEADPFAVGWFAIAGEAMNITTMSGKIERISKGDAVCYRKWYGKGLAKVTATQVARGILEREAKDPNIMYRVAGGDIEKASGVGPSVYEKFGEEGVHFMRADNRRSAGAVEFRERIVGKQDVPGLYWFEECSLELETIMNLQHDVNDVNDCTQHDDHFYEMCRYFCMSRPYSTAKPAKDKSLEERFKEPSINELWELKKQLDTYR